MFTSGTFKNKAINFVVVLAACALAVVVAMHFFVKSQDDGFTAKLDLGK